MRRSEIIRGVVGRRTPRSPRNLAAGCRVRNSSNQGGSGPIPETCRRAAARRERRRRRRRRTASTNASRSPRLRAANCSRAILRAIRTPITPFVSLGNCARNTGPIGSLMTPFGDSRGVHRVHEALIACRACCRIALVWGDLSLNRAQPSSAAGSLSIHGESG